MIRYNEIVDRIEPYNNPSDISYHLAGVAPTTLAPPTKEDTMTALQTVAEQIHIFGTYVTSYKEEHNTYTDVYRIDHASKASIKYKGNHEVISVTFSR